MIIKFNLGTFLNNVYPKRLNNYSRECFLDDLFYLIIDDNSILDKKGKSYCFGRELASRLFSNKSDMPQAIQKAITAHTFSNKKYIDNAQRIFNKSMGESNIYCAVSNLMTILKMDHTFDEKYLNEINKLLSDKMDK